MDQLNPTHKYCTQCQIQMYVTELSSCDFYIWLPHGHFSIILFLFSSFSKKLMPMICIFIVTIITKFVCFYFCCLTEKIIHKKLFILHNKGKKLYSLLDFTQFIYTMKKIVRKYVCTFASTLDA